MSHPRVTPPGELPQTQLALELRYAIDIARRINNDTTRQRVKDIIEANPINVRSRHVEHNLGVARIAWLKERPSLGWKGPEWTSTTSSSSSSRRAGSSPKRSSTSKRSSGTSATTRRETASSRP